MPSALDFPARGKILRVENNLVVFNPTGTNYELQLVNAGKEPLAPSQNSVQVFIRANARKVWTMPSGGNFVTPIFGPPKIIQGRVRYLDEKTMVLHAATSFILTLPAEATSFDLNNGPVQTAGIVNATILPGATIELAPTPLAV